MSREIRRVPADWQHPKDERGEYISMHDEDFHTAARKWIADLMAWENGTYPDVAKDPTIKEHYQFWQWHNGPPDEKTHRPVFTSEPTHYQVYQTVSEGTPVSPVLPSPEAVEQWCISQGHSEHAAKRFVESGWAPSGVMMGGHFASGIDSYDL